MIFIKEIFEEKRNEMLTKIQFKIEKNSNINVNSGSLFHGALMELIDKDYGDILHENSLKPFSQNLQVLDENIIWTVNCLNDECSKKFSEAIKGIEKINIKKKDLELNILSKRTESNSYKDFIDDTYFSDAGRIFKIYFNTPATFKINGRYSIYPDLTEMYKNLIRRFDAFSDGFSLYDEDMLDTLISSTNIIGYKLKSTVYHIESIKIPSFIGYLIIRVSGTAQTAQIAKLLLKYSEYSGVGIKTALGMGQTRIEEVIKR